MRDRYPQFQSSVRAVNAVLRKLTAAPAPSIDEPSAGDLIELLNTGRRFRALGRRNAYSLLRWLPMPVADFAQEWFEHDALRAAVAARRRARIAPRPAIGRQHGDLSAVVGAARGTARRRMDGARRRRRRQRSARPQPPARRASRSAPARASSTSSSATRSPQGVVLDTGEEIQARAVVSSADPRRTLLARRPAAPSAGLPRCGTPHPDARHALEGQLRRVRAAARSRACPPRHAAARARRCPAGSGSRATSTRSSARYDAAKYGAIADEPFVELAIPSLVDPSLAPAGQHVVSAYVQFTPLELRGTTWDAERERLGDARHARHRAYARRVRAADPRPASDHSGRPRTRYGLTGGPHLPRRAGARSASPGAAAARLGPLSRRPSATSICAARARTPAPAWTAVAARWPPGKF